MRLQVQRGFSLLEVIVAFALAAIALGVLSQIFGQGARNMALAEDYDSALLLAESLLAEHGTLATSNETLISERTGQFQWTVSIQPVSAPEETPQFTPAPDRDAATPAQLVRIDVDVAWERNQKSRSVNLSSLRLASAEDNDRAF